MQRNVLETSGQKAKTFRLANADSPIAIFTPLCRSYGCDSFHCEDVISYDQSLVIAMWRLAQKQCTK